MAKPRVFFFHYNKPASRSAKRPQISVHWQKKCLIVDNVTCYAPTKGHINKRQPFFVMKGKATSVEVVGNVALIHYFGNPRVIYNAL